MDNWEQFRQEKNGKLIPNNTWCIKYSTIEYKEWELFYDIYSTNNGVKENFTRRLNTRIRVPIASNRDFKFLIFPSSFIHKLGKYFKMKALEIGDKAFDKEFVITGNDLSAIKYLLSEDKLKNMFHEKLIGRIGTKDIKQRLFRKRLPLGVDILHFEVNEEITDKETLEEITLLVTTLLDRLVAIHEIKKSSPNFTPQRAFKTRTKKIIIIGVFLLIYSIQSLVSPVKMDIEESSFEEETQINQEIEDVVNTESLNEDIVSDTEELNNNESNPFTITSILPNGPSTVFNNVALYSTFQLLTPISNCTEGDSITIQEIASIYTAEEQNKIQLSRNIYKVIHKGKEGYLKASDLAMKGFNIGETTFITGTDNLSGKLILKAFKNDKLMDTVDLMSSAYRINAWGTGYDLFRLQFKQIDNLDFEGIHFFNFTNENNGSDGWQEKRTYYWNGSTCEEVTTDERISSIIEAKIIFPSDKNGIKDTLTYKAITGYMDEAGDITEQETHLFYFTLNDGILKQVSEK